MCGSYAMRHSLTQSCVTLSLQCPLIIVLPFAPRNRGSLLNKTLTIILKIKYIVSEVNGNGDLFNNNFFLCMVRRNIETNIADGHCSVGKRKQNMVRLHCEMFGSHIGAADSSSLLITYFPPLKMRISPEKKKLPPKSTRGLTLGIGTSLKY